MKTIILTIAASFFLLAANAQSSSVLRLNNRRPSDPALQPLFILNDSVINEDALRELNPDKIASINILKDSSAVAVYGPKAVNGVVIVHTKDKSVYLDLTELFDQYHIAADDRKLKITIDNILVRNRNKIMTDKQDILRVEVNNDACWKSPTEAGAEELHVNIVTKKSALTNY